MTFTPSGNGDFLPVVEDFGTFASSDQIEKAGQTTEVYNGGALVPYILGGRPSAGEFTVTRPFDRARDMPLYRKYLPKVNSVYLGVQLYPTDQALQRDGAYFSGRCLLKGMTIPAVDGQNRSNPQPAMMTLRLHAPDWSVQQ